MVKLKYMGHGEYIAMIPNRDLTDFDIETITARDGITEQELIEMLCSRGLYKLTKGKAGKAAIKREMEEIATKQEDSDNDNSINRTEETDTDR